jgi:hypothetical protein
MSPEANDNALIPVGELGAVKYDDETFDKIAASKYLARIQLMTSNSKPCKGGEFPTNHYAFVRGKTNTDMTAEVNVLVIAWRPKAIRMDDSVMAFYDTENPEFKKIEDEADENDSGCMFGPEFLCYVPSLKDFGIFFMGSKSSRNESPSMKALIGKSATLRVQKLSNKKYEWFSPQVVPCSTPFEIPEMDLIKEQVEKFNNPPVNDVETVDGDDSERAR